MRRDLITEGPMTNPQGNRQGQTVALLPWIREALKATAKKRGDERGKRMPVSEFMREVIVAALDPEIRKQYEPKEGR
jgi:hypothetical protein